VKKFYRNGYTDRVHRITKSQLNRGANALADVAAGIRAKARSLKKGGGGGGGDGGGAKCDPAYPGVCIPPPPPDKDCGDVSFTNFKVKPADPHNFDSDSDGVGCES
jgi:micrococcal nuclease